MRSAVNIPLNPDAMVHDNLDAGQCISPLGQMANAAVLSKATCQNRLISIFFHTVLTWNKFCNFFLLVLSNLMVLISHQEEVSGWLEKDGQNYFDALRNEGTPTMTTNISHD